MRLEVKSFRSEGNKPSKPLTCRLQEIPNFGLIICNCSSVFKKMIGPSFENKADNSALHGTFLSKPYPPGLREYRRESRMLRAEVRKKDREMLSSEKHGYHMQMWWLPAQNLYKTKPANIPVWVERESGDPTPSFKFLAVGGCN